MFRFSAIGHFPLDAPTWHTEYLACPSLCTILGNSVPVACLVTLTRSLNKASAEWKAQRCLCWKKETVRYKSVLPERTPQSIASHPKNHFPLPLQLLCQKEFSARERRYSPSVLPSFPFSLYCCLLFPPVSITASRIQQTKPNHANGSSNSTFRIWKDKYNPRLPATKAPADE